MGGVGARRFDEATAACPAGEPCARGTAAATAPKAMNPITKDLAFAVRISLLLAAG
jgi:hypothetical protein